MPETQVTLYPMDIIFLKWRIRLGKINILKTIINIKAV
jgi:hypothetical protein